MRSSPAATTSILRIILVGSEGTLAFSTRIELKLSPLLGRRAVGACHFGRFHDAMEAAQHIVKLGPIAVELVDRTMIELAREIAMFRPTLDAFVRETPDAILLVEFGEDDHEENLRRLKRLEQLIGDIGFSWSGSGARWGGVVEVLDPRLQAGITDVRTAGLNIMMSMKEEGKPVSFVEDCAVPLEHLADYTDKLTRIFEQHGTRGTWYAHASVGCLHVRPVLNLRLDKDVTAMRAIAEEAFELVRAYKGSHSGEHGDGIVRSEFHESMFGPRLVRAFEEVKDLFDPENLFNPGKIVRAPKFDDRRYFRYGPGYRGEPMTMRLDWSAFPGAGGGFQGAVEMCNNNGACRNLSGGVMCPSYRVTRNERDVTRGRANTLRLAITGQLGPDALHLRRNGGDAETLRFLQGMPARMSDRRRHGAHEDRGRMRRAPPSTGCRCTTSSSAICPTTRRSQRDCRGCSTCATSSRVCRSFRNRSPASARGAACRAGGRMFSTKESWPLVATGFPEVVLFADTFNRYFERENLDAAVAVLKAGGYRVYFALPADGSPRPLCCGRTFLAVGLIEDARREAERTIAALEPFVARGVPIVGLEPSCVLGFRDEIPALTRERERLIGHTFLLEEFLAQEAEAGRLQLPLGPHCQARSRARPLPSEIARRLLRRVETVLKLIPDLQVETIDSSCCGMAGSFGFAADTIDVSLAMGELSLLPAVRKADADTHHCRRRHLLPPSDP